MNGNEHKTPAWQQASDEADSNLLTPNLPELANVGDTITDNTNNRVYKYIKVMSGNAGARWAYWVGAILKENSIYEPPDCTVVADKIFNGGAWHFAGMLVMPYSGARTPTCVWILTNPNLTAAELVEAQKKVYIEDAAKKPKTRYERNREDYDLESGTVKEIGRTPREEGM